jgi:hypothetical protein
MEVRHQVRHEVGGGGKAKARWKNKARGLKLPASDSETEKRREIVQKRQRQTKEEHAIAYSDDRALDVDIVREGDILHSTSSKSQ